MTTTVLEKKIHNYTPHTITIRHYGNAGYIHREFESKGCARVLMDPEKPLEHILGIPVVETYSTGTVTGLPEPEVGTHLIVSIQTYIAANGRFDLLVPHGAVRDSKTNRILHCAGFCRPMLDFTILAGDYPRRMK